MEPFTLTCTTCQARLKIMDAAAIGQIHACPRCGGMVKITAPATVKATSEATKPAEALADAAEKSVASSDSPPLSLDEIAAQAASASTAATPAPDQGDGAVDGGNGPWSFLHDPRIAWVCVPLAIILTLLIVWSSNQPAPSAAETNLAQVSPDDDAGNSGNPPTKPADVSLPSAPAPSNDKSANPPPVKPALPVLPPAANPAETKSSSPVGDSNSSPPTTVKPDASPTKPPQLAATSPGMNATTKPPADGKLAPAIKPSDQNVATTPSPMPSPTVPPTDAVELPKPDFTAALQNEFERIEFTDVALCDWLRFVGRAANLPISLDADQMVDRGRKLDQPLSIKKYNLTVQELLKTVLADIELDFIAQDYQLLVFPADQTPLDLVSEKHSTAPFTQETPEQLGDLIRLLIDPASWVDADGRGTMKVADRDLIVNQTPAVQRQVRQLLRGLHQLRDKTFTAAHRFQRADAKLATPVRVNFPGPTPLPQISEHLRKQYGLITLVDYESLAVEQKSSQITASLVVHDVPLGDALQTLLEPHGLVLRVVDTNAVEITTSAGAERRADLEFYPLGKLLVAGEPIDRVLQRVKEALPEVTWRETGGVGTLGIDSATGTLIVRHSQAVQRRVADWIAKQGK